MDKKSSTRNDAQFFVLRNVNGEMLFAALCSCERMKLADVEECDCFFLVDDL
jgi:hypothetical protein